MTSDGRLRRALTIGLILAAVCLPRPGAAQKAGWPQPAAAAAAAKEDFFLVEFAHSVPPKLPGGATLTPVTERIALSRVDPRTLPQPPALLFARDPHAIRRVERNVRFIVQQAAALPPHPLRDLRGTQATPWSALSPARGARAALWAQPGARRARVGIIDTGLDYTHPDLLGNVGAGVNFLAPAAAKQTPRSLPPPFGEEHNDATEMDYNGHGTHVAGIIGARHNDFGIDGVATAVELIGLKVFDRHGTAYLSDILQAVAHATDARLDILNMSFGTYEHSAMLEDALARAHAAGIVLVAAAGNDGVAAATFPARLPFVTSVGALGPHGVSRMSNYGGEVDVYAPGHEVMSTTTCMLGPQVYTAMSGTSAAAAEVTGVMAQAMLSAMDAPAAQAFMQARLSREPARFTPRGVPSVRVLHAPTVLADLQAKTHTALRLTHLSAHQTDDTTLSVTVRVQNIGNRATPADTLRLRLWQQQDSHSVEAGILPALAPQEAHLADITLALPSGWVTAQDTSVGVEAALQAQTLTGASPMSAALSRTPKARVQVGGIRVTWPQARTMHVLLRNVGRAPARHLTARGFGIPATHEGIWSVPRTALTRVTEIEELAPQAQVEVELPIQGELPRREAWTWLVELAQDGRQVERAIQSWDLLPTGQAQLYYNQRAHMGMVETAVDLLRLQNIILPDLHDPTAPYKGSAETARDWGSAVSVGMSNWHWRWKTDWPAYPESARTLVDGASAADGIDIAFNDGGVSTWDTHYWVVDEGDAAGLGDVSALQKIDALMLGGYGSRIEEGAIAAYQRGDKARAWWMVGHAAHLLGDLSTAAHTLNRNWHGVIGDPYHDWMGKHYQAWPATVPLLQGGYIDPYRSDLLTAPERLRFLAYTVARIGASFPWHQKRGWIPVKGERFGEGSRTLRGDHPHYDDYLTAIFATFPAHPRLLRDITKEEALTLQNECIAVDALEAFQYLADCWDGGDGHIDRNNLLYDDMDGDLSRIADQAYTYGVRAIAGLLVMFATETGQI